MANHKRVLLLFFISLLLTGQSFSQSIGVADSASRLISAQKYEDAIQLLTSSLSSTSRSIPLLQLLGDAYRLQQNYDKAFESYKEIITLNDCDTCTLFYKQAGGVALAGKRYDDAIEYFTHTMKKGDTLSGTYLTQAYLERANHSYTNEDYDDARDDYLHIIQQAHDTLLYTNLLVCYADLEEEDSLMALCRQLVDMFPDFVIPGVYLSQKNYEKGLYYFHDKRYTQAINYFLQTLRYAPTHASASYYTGISYLRTGNKELSMRYLKQAYDFYSRKDLVGKELYEVYKALGCYEEALPLLSDNSMIASWKDKDWLALSKIYYQKHQMELWALSYREAAYLGCGDCEDVLEEKKISLIQWEEESEGIIRFFHSFYPSMKPAVTDTNLLKDPPDYIRVSKQPSPITQISPEYPTTAKKLHIGGTVWVKCLVSQEGTVAKALIMESDVEIFNTISLDAARQWIFSPAIANQQPIAVWVAIPFRFKYR